MRHFDNFAAWLIRKGVERQPDEIISRDGEAYLQRWHLIPKNRFCNIYLHRFSRSDHDAPHDHPWASATLVLKTGYLERLARGYRWCAPGGLYFRRSVTTHQVVLTQKSGDELLPVWTLFITGPKVRDWGFHCPKGFVPWQEFVNPTNSGEIGPGCGE